MTESRSLKEEDKFKELGNKICKFVGYYGKEGGQKILSIAALTDVLFSIKGIFKMYDERIKELEKYNLEHGINKIKIGGTDPD